MTTAAAIAVKASNLTFTVLKLYSNNIKDICDQLKQKLELFPGFFSDVNVVLDCAEVEESLDIVELRAQLKLLGLSILAISNANHQLLSLAKDSHIPQINLTQQKKQPIIKTYSQQILHKNIRSGQQVYAKDADLIIFGNVGHGAEVMADGSIHIYGTLRGKALAGGHNNHQACITVQNNQAELIAIAGNYQIAEQMNGQAFKQTCVIKLIDGHLQITHNTLQGN